MVLRILLALALLVSVAHAQDKPWAKGVSAKDQELALTLYNTANDLFEKGSYTAALANYQAALKAWDHPGIHFNTAMCLRALERWVEAYEHIEKALAYGDAPLGQDLYAEGRAFHDELKQKVGTLEVTLKTPGAVVKLDGETLLAAPGTVRRLVLARQEHSLVAEKPAYETEARTLVLEPNATTTLVLEMKLKTGGTQVRRWAAWKPWAVVAASGVIGIAGGVAVWTSKQKFDNADAIITQQCSAGCEAGSDAGRAYAQARDAAARRQNIGYGVVAAGGATLAVGLVLVVLNQPRLVGGTVEPSIGKEHAGATVTFAW